MLDFVESLSSEEQSLLADYVRGSVWNPFSGPQEEARESEADVLFYGGAAGGGKTDLLVGLTLTEHKKSIIFRREATQLTGIVDRMTDLLGSRKGYNGAEKIWRMSERQVEFGSTPDLGDEVRYQGRPHDLICFDEISNFLEVQFRFLMGWLRTTDPNQRCRVVCAGNPPTSSDGDWVRKYWGPWLDPNHDNPAEPGELRWYITVEGEDVEVEDGTPRLANLSLTDKKDPNALFPKSRTFIPSKVQDNPYLLGTNYLSTLQALPEPLRSQMLYGDFSAGVGDDAWQVIPTSWVHMAVERWREREGVQMTAMGVDPSRGGDDESVIFCCFDNDWFDHPHVFPGHVIPDGPSLGSEVVRVRRDGCEIFVDGIGIGVSVVDFLDNQGLPVESVTGSEKVSEVDDSGTFRFRNRRAYNYWRLRERLDPKNSPSLCLPPCSPLIADLTAARFKVNEGNVVQVEGKPELRKRLGRSTDYGDALIYASIETEPVTGSTFLVREGRVKRNLTCVRQPKR